MGYRYIGSKTRVVSALIDVISEIAPKGATVVDLMTGTGTVALALRRAGYRVIANDLMTYSYHHARVNLMFSAEPKFNSIGAIRSSRAQPSLLTVSRYEEVLGWLDSVEPVAGYFWNEFSREGVPGEGVPARNYFSPENARKIDGVRRAITELHATGKTTELENSLLIHTLILAANDAANIAGTYGHFLSKTVQRSVQPISLKPVEVPVIDDGGHVVLQGYAEENASRISADVCYIDPPYMKRQYAANYHLLETLARGDAPRAIGVSGLRPWRDQYSDFCTKTKIWLAFEKILKGMDCQQFLVSYSEDGLVSKAQLEEFFGQFGVVSTYTFENKRFKSNDSSLAPTLTEYIIHLRR